MAEAASIEDVERRSKLAEQCGQEIDSIMVLLERLDYPAMGRVIVGRRTWYGGAKREPRAAWRIGEFSYVLAGETIKSLFKALSDRPRQSRIGPLPGASVAGRF